MCECCIQPPAQLSSTCSARGGELGGIPRLISSSKKKPGNEAGWGARLHHSSLVPRPSHHPAVAGGKVLERG